MVGGVFQGQHHGRLQLRRDHRLHGHGRPGHGTLTTVTLSTPVVGRYVRYLAPNGSDGDVAEVQFFE